MAPPCRSDSWTVARRNGSPVASAWEAVLLDDLERVLWNKHRDELAMVWQGRLLAHTRYEPVGMVVLSILAHNYDTAMPVLLRAIFPGFESISTPFICSTARIDKNGAVVADVVWDDWQPVSKDQVIFHDETHMRDRLRKLADQLKLSDDDRKQLFIAARKWCA